MKFQKEELSFLNHYIFCADTKTSISDKIQIKTDVESSSVIFSQFSSDITLITRVNKEITEEFCYTLSSIQFGNFIKSLPANCVIDINDQEISFNKSKYKFEVFPESLSNTDHYLNIVENLTIEDTLNVKEFQKVTSIKQYIGTEKLDTVALMDGHFVSSNRTEVTGVVKTINDQNEVFYLPKIVVNLGLQNKLDSISINKYENGELFSFKIENTYFLFLPKNYILPNIFEDDFKDIYEHPCKCFVNKNELKESLQRIKIIASLSVDSMIFMYFQNNVLRIKSSTSGYGEEELNATYIDDMPSVDNINITLRVDYLISIISQFKGDQVCISVPKDAEAPVIKITDETEESFYLQTVFQEEA